MKKPILINDGNVDDVRGSLRHLEARLSIGGLWSEIDLERAARSRTSVLSMLLAAIRRKLNAMPIEEYMQHYPIREFSRKRYVRWPVQNENGKWEAVDVQPEGYSKILGAAQFDTEEEYMKACMQGNSFCGFTRKRVPEVVSWSMLQSAKLEEEKLKESCSQETE